VTRSLDPLSLRLPLRVDGLAVIRPALLSLSLCVVAAGAAAQSAPDPVKPPPKLPTTLPGKLPSPLPTKVPVDVGPVKLPASLAPATSPAAPTRREVTVDFVWFTGEPGTDAVKGGTSPATVRIDANGAPGASVGVLEEFAGGAGPQWRATAWIAALTAAHASSTSFLQHEWTVRAGGMVDGPSAGLLTTASFLALLKGDAVLPEVTMTGTINPDGTAGPVSGIPQKIEGAAAAGKKRFGYPVGARQAEDARTGKLVDVEKLARSLGMDAVELRTLRDAYRLLTGKDPGAPTLAGDDDVRISPEQMEAAQVRVDMWRASAEAGYGRIQPTLSSLSDEARASLSWLYTPIFAEVNAAQGYERGGQLVAAEHKWSEVTIATAAAEDELKILAAAGEGRLEEAFQVLAPYLELEEQAGQLLDELEDSFATAQGTVSAVNAVLAAETIVDSLALVATGKAGLDAAVLTAKQLEADAAAGRIEASQQKVQQFVVLLLRTAPVLARAEAMLAAARMELAFEGTVDGGGAALDGARLAELARGYASAASAGRAYFQGLVGLTDEGAASFAFVEPQWATASAGAALAATWAGKTTPVAQLFAVASGAHAALAAAALQNKYYALGFKDGAIQRRAALSAQMTSAREAALAAVARVKAATGKVPERVIAEFHHAEELREGPDADKLLALSSYWRASFAAALAAELGPGRSTP
jgi:uncharacterized protein